MFDTQTEKARSSSESPRRERLSAVHDLVTSLSSRAIDALSHYSAAVPIEFHPSQVQH